MTGTSTNQPARDETPLTFRAWVVTGGRSEWHLVQAADLEAAKTAAAKKWKHKLVGVRPGAVPSKEDAW